MRHIKFFTFLTTVFLACSLGAQIVSQSPVYQPVTTISGVINLYTSVTEFSCDSTRLTVSTATGFAIGDEVLLIQMQGASVDLTNSAAFGNVLNFQNAGNYEFNRIKSISGNKISLQFELSRSYNLNGKVQLIRVPEYNDVTALDLTCQAWNGNTGGVLVLDVAGTLTLTGNCNVTGKGFRGGQVVDTDNASSHEIQYFYPVNPSVAAAKGEGIALAPVNQSYGRGKIANGGGGGNAHNAGGGGGANGGNGGNGGLEYYNTPFSPTPNTDGIGGASTPVLVQNPNNILLGGGGGAGHTNDQVGTSGGNGGGIIIIKSGKIKSNNFGLLANGTDVLSPGDQRNDGQGGGGGGGTILLQMNELEGNLDCEAKGGRGGDCLFYVQSQIIGPGGGGSGGKVQVNQAFPNLSYNLSGGIHGIANQGLSNGAQNGEVGQYLSGFSFVQDSLLNIQNTVDLQFCDGDSYEIDGIVYQVSNTVIASFEATNGCDSLVEYHLQFSPLPTTLTTISLCPGQSITIGGISYDQPGIVTDTVPSLSGGCDTLATFVLLRADQPVTHDTLSLCPGDSLIVSGQVYLTPGTYLDTLYSSSPDACDTLAYTTLVPAPMDLVFQIDQIECDGGTIRVSGTLCNLGSAPLPEEVWIRLYNSDPFTETPSASVSFLVGSTNMGSCLNLLLDGIDPDVVANGVVYAVVSDDGTGNYPLSADDFPVTNVVECNYANNLSVADVTLPAPPPLELGPDVHLCAPGTVVFDAGNDFIAYLWQDGSTGQTFLAGSPGSYHVEVKDACGRVQRDTVQFSIDTVFHGQLADMTLCLGQQGSATVDGFDTYAWSPVAGLSCTDCGTVTIQPTETTTYTIFAQTAGGCTFYDTFTVIVLPLPTQALTVGFCPGNGVVIDGQFYTQSGTVIDTVAATDGGCDKIVTYTLVMLPNPTLSQSIEFCPGDSVVINGQAYSQPGTVVDTLPAGMDEGCDTIATYTLSWLPQPAFTQTIKFCKGEEVVIAGQIYTEPGTVLDTLPSTTGGCDTLATYVLQYLTPTTPTAVSINCPSDISVEAAPGQAAVAIPFDPATATSDCPCPGIDLHQTAGLPSGSAFPVGNTQVCYEAADSCGNTASCCFSVSIQAAPEACDIKTIGCVKFELLGISVDAELNRRYTIRLTNNCSNKLIYTAFQAPDGVTALYPAENSIFTAPSGRSYLVRNPNYSPFYSVRFKSVSDSIANGEYDVFQYRLPAQAADPLFIHAMVRLEPQIYYEVHLNTFYCPVIPETSSKPDPGMEQERELASGWLRVFPNPTDGTLWVSLTEIPQQPILLQIFNAQGQRVQEQPVQAAMDEAVQLQLRPELPNGLYYLHMIADDGVPQVVRFVLQR